MGQNVALVPTKIPVYQPIRNYEAVGMTFGEHLVHNARHQMLPHGIDKFNIQLSTKQ